MTEPKLTCFVMEGHPVDLRPAKLRKPWMDQTPRSFAYRCLPLNTANSHGWELLSPADFEVEWNGGDQAEDVQVHFDGEPHHSVASHFGSGIITFVPNVVIRTPPGTNIWVSGSPNSFKNGIQALSAMIESDWMPYSFTMNWKITQPGLRIRFEKGEPYCFFFPIQRGLVEDMEPEIRPITSDPELTESFEVAYGRRLAVHHAGNGANSERRTLKKKANWYMLGLSPDGEQKIPEHQVKICPRAFIGTPAESADSNQDGK